jgi:hypothetical protein
MRPLTPREIARHVSVLVFTIGVVCWLRVGPMFDPVWTAGGGEPVPRNFSYMLFPRGDAGIMDEAGERVVPFRRALMIDDEHYRADGLVDVGGAKGVRQVAMADLTPAAPPGTLDMLWNDWQAHETVPAGNLQSAEFSIRPGRARTTLATLKLCRAARCYKFVYEINRDTVRPLRMYSTGWDVFPMGQYTLLGLLGLWVLYSMVAAMLDRVLPGPAAKPVSGETALA